VRGEPAVLLGPLHRLEYDLAPVGGQRKLSQAIAEGDGISVLVEIVDAAGARTAEEQGADGLVVRHAAPGVASELPLLVFPAGHEGAEENVDAVVLHYDDEDELLEARFSTLSGRGLECALWVADDEDVERVLDVLDPEIFVLSPDRADDEQTELDRVLELLPDIPAGKLAIADLPGATAADVVELERAGVDAVIVRTAEIRSLVGDEPPHV
jgi:hypothetical protein